MRKRPGCSSRKGWVKSRFCTPPAGVVLWGAGKEICGAKDWKEALKRPGVRKIALANPVTAPYGAAAEAALKKSGLWTGDRRAARHRPERGTVLSVRRDGRNGRRLSAPSRRPSRSLAPGAAIT